MCGLAGILHLDGSPVDPNAISRMSETLHHRGPDDHGYHVDGPVALAHRRLSILDLSTAGHQPMCNEDGSIWVVFNGEIYNYVELAAELRGRGHQFRSTSDTEVILHMYEDVGERCLDRFHGMFSIVLWDSRRGILLAARDRVGIKPLYYARNGDALLFGSEIKALLAHPAQERRIDAQGLADIMFCGYPLEGRTAFAGISQLNPGEAMVVKDGAVRRWQYWNVRYEYDHQRTFADTAAELNARLDRVVHDHCRSDAPVGSHLSGGLDSSTVAALSARHRSPLHTFSIRFSEGGPYDESHHARSVAQAIGSMHSERRPQPEDLSALLPFLAWHMDIPMTKSAFSYFSSSRLARDHVKVALTGHGGDELMAGYPAHFAVTFGDTSMFQTNRPAPPKVPLFRRALRAARAGGARGVLNRVITRAQAGSAQSLDEQWITLHCGLTPDKNPALGNPLRAALAGYDPTDGYIEPFHNAPTDELLDRCMYHDLKCYLPGLLHAEDRVSMSVSLESRVPLLDHTLIEFLATVPPAMKVPRRVPKELLRTAMKDVLPEDITNRRDKGAFFVPAGEWLRADAAGWVRDQLLSDTTLDRGVLSADWIRSAVRDGDDLWELMSIELWCRLHIDCDPQLLDKVEEARSTFAQMAPA